MRIFDANVGVGHWPFRKLAVETAEQLRSELTRAGIKRALVYSINAVFYKDVHSGNMELAELASGESWAHIAAVINPTRPGALDDLNEAVAELATCAVRLFPGYHGYALDDPWVERFLSALREAHPRMPVVITVRLEDERLHHPMARVPAVDLAPVAELASRFPERPFILAGVNLGAAKQVRDAVGADASVFYEISRMTDQEFLRTALEALPAERLIFGTNLPLFNPGSGVQKIVLANAPDVLKQKILGANLEALLETG